MWRRSFGRVLLRPPAGGDLVVLGAGGPALWDVLARPCSLEEAAGALGARHDVGAETVAADISPVLQRLVELALVIVDETDVESTT